MKSRRDIKNSIMPYLAQNEGMAERIEERLGFKVLWSRLDIFQTVMVYYACEAELGNNRAVAALFGMMDYDNHCPDRAPRTS